MMIEKIKRKSEDRGTRDGFDVICDHCPDAFFVEVDDFIDAVRALRSKGWRAYQVGDVWEHKCSDCRAAEKENSSPEQLFR